MLELVRNGMEQKSNKIGYFELCLVDVCLSKVTVHSWCLFNNVLEGKSLRLFLNIYILHVEPKNKRTSTTFGSKVLDEI